MKSSFLTIILTFLGFLLSGLSWLLLAGFLNIFFQSSLIWDVSMVLCWIYFWYVFCPEMTCLIQGRSWEFNLFKSVTTLKFSMLSVMFTIIFIWGENFYKVVFLILRILHACIWYCKCSYFSLIKKFWLSCQNVSHGRNFCDVKMKNYKLPLCLWYVVISAKGKFSQSIQYLEKWESYPLAKIRLYSKEDSLKSSAVIMHCCLWKVFYILVSLLVSTYL